MVLVPSRFYSIQLVGVHVVFPSQVHNLRGLLTLILGGVETNNKLLVTSAVRRMEAQLAVCACCPIFPLVEEDEANVKQQFIRRNN